MMATPGQGNLLQAVFYWLLTYALHSTVLLGGVWLINRQLRERALWLQESLWKMALCGGILTATIQLAGGVRPLGGGIALGTPSAASSPVAAVRALPALPTAVAVADVAPLLPEAAPAVLRTEARPRPSVLDALRGAAGPARAGVVLGGLWLVVALWLLARNGRALGQLHVRLARRRPEHRHRDRRQTRDLDDRRTDRRRFDRRRDGDRRRRRRRRDPVRQQDGDDRPGDRLASR